MIPIRLLNGSRILVNAELVESVAAAHDTVITLTTGRKIVSSTRPQEVVEAILDYRRRVREPGGLSFGLAGPAAAPGDTAPPAT